MRLVAPVVLRVTDRTLGAIHRAAGVVHQAQTGEADAGGDIADLRQREGRQLPAEEIEGKVSFVVIGTQQRDEFR